MVSKPAIYSILQLFNTILVHLQHSRFDRDIGPPAILTVANLQGWVWGGVGVGWVVEMKK